MNGSWSLNGGFKKWRGAHHNPLNEVSTNGAARTTISEFHLVIEWGFEEMARRAPVNGGSTTVIECQLVTEWGFQEVPRRATGSAGEHDALTSGWPPFPNHHLLTQNGVTAVLKTAFRLTLFRQRNRSDLVATSFDPPRLGFRLGHQLNTTP